MRKKIKLLSSSGSGHFYITTKSKKGKLKNLELKKYDPKVLKHVLYKEIKLK